jgi:hypothetical protein
VLWKCDEKVKELTVKSWNNDDPVFKYQKWQVVEYCERFLSKISNGTVIDMMFGV